MILTITVCGNRKDNPTIKMHLVYSNRYKYLTSNQAIHIKIVNARNKGINSSRMLFRFEQFIMEIEDIVNSIVNVFYNYGIYKIPFRRYPIG